jgi:hypothetical protein
MLKFPLFHTLFAWFAQVFCIVVLATVFWSLATFKLVQVAWLPFFIVFFASLKVAYLLYVVYKKIEEAVHKNLAFHHFLLFMLANMTLAILSFAADFWNSYVINPASFEGINPQFAVHESIFEFIYFSTLTFSYFGYGNILPQIISTKFLVMMEVCLAFLNLIFVLADFIGLRESLRNSK